MINTNAAVHMPWLASVRSVLEMWYPGQEGGTATADLLNGEANPSGKLPITFPANNGATPFAWHPERSTGTNGSIIWSEGLEMGYRWYLANGVAPLFPFGFGMSYTSFTYSHLRIAKRHGTAAGKITVSFRVRNTGNVTGTEVPQLYLTLPASSGEPSRRLANFARVTLRPQQSTRVEMTIDPRSTDRPLSIWDTRSHAWQTLTGRYRISIGSSVLDTPLTARFTLG